LADCALETTIADVQLVHASGSFHLKRIGGTEAVTFGKFDAIWRLVPSKMRVSRGSKMTPTSRSMPITISPQDYVLFVSNDEKDLTVNAFAQTVPSC
jgi:hypothetical protein